MIEVVERLDKSEVVVTIGFLRLVPPQEVSGRQTLERRRVQVSLDAEDGDYFVNVVRNLHSLFQAVDSARLVCDEVLAQIDDSHRFVLPAPTVDALSKTNPLVVDVSGGLAPLTVLTTVVGIYAAWWIAHNRGRLIRKKGDVLAEVARAQRIRNDRAEFTNVLLQAGVVRHIVVQRVADALPPATAPQALDTARLDSLIERQLLPSIEQLFTEEMKSITAEGTEEEALPQEIRDLLDEELNPDDPDEEA